jgi:hypothetical protein
VKGHHLTVPAPVRTNIRILQPSRKRLSAGDVFAISLPDDSFLFGRVIATDLPRERAPMPGANLVYIYDLRADAPEPPLDKLTVDRLLIPPLFINRLPWSRGYFHTIRSTEMTPNDQLSRHYFWSVARRTYVDETGQPVDFVPPPPVGDWGLHSFRTADDAISEVLGFPLVPDDVEV